MGSLDTFGQLVGFFKDLFQSHHLVDMLPDVLVRLGEMAEQGMTTLPKDWIVF
jgi:hypothetical protein